MENLLRVGVISSSHGIRGEVKVFPTTDDVNRFKKLKSVVLDTGKEQLTLTIESVKFFKQFAIVKFKEFNDINEILKYKGKDLLITREQAVPLKKDEFFICDLIGCLCETEEGEDLGTLSEVIQTGANDVFVIKKEDEELLIPYIDDCVKSVDIKEKKIVVHLLEGLR